MIRYDKKLEQEINKTIKNFNQKISKLEKQKRELLPNKITKKELKTITNRKELQKKLKELQLFGKRGIEDIIEISSGKITKYEIQKLKNESKKVKQQLTREINKLKTTKPKIFGVLQDATFAQMGDQNYLNLETRRKALNKNITKLDKQQLSNYIKLINKTNKNKEYLNNQFKENYVKMVTDLGYYNNFDNEKLEKLKNKIRKLNNNDFLDLIKNDKAIRAILDYYPIATGTMNINPEDIEQDVTDLYNNLIDNFDEITKDYA